MIRSETPILYKNLKTLTIHNMLELYIRLTRQTFKRIANILKNKQNKLSTDASLHIDRNDVIRSNTSLFTEYFELNNEYEVILQNTPSNIIYVAVNGVILVNQITQYSLNNNKITIHLPELTSKFSVSVCYQYQII